ncbi:hypothetical protein [uncultured Litoreibacter sp.]|uniref:hypothetical protein n=1 Tax=uncultured Litoreibacter sp. TaxID=1392394 RepID=UPI00262F631E|nr:hypothetical protein [uncultured Litoreibacter sp.]
MLAISDHVLPEDALLQRYNDGSGHYTDCFTTHISRRTTLPEFVEAFYTAPLFRAERVVLRYIAKRPSTDQDASDVAHARATKFAVWEVEDRSASQLLMCDVSGKTRSWFMTRDTEHGTQLFFGSAVTANPTTGTVGVLIKATAWLHVIYSRALLKGAVKRINQGPSPVVAR